MIDIHEFGRQFTDKLLTISAENQGVGRIEAVRKYHSDPKFKTMVDTIVLAAVQTVSDMEGIIAGRDPLREAFDAEAAQLLGWDQPGSPRH